VQRIPLISPLICLLFLTLDATTAAANHLKVRTPYALDKGELEAGYWLDAFLNTPVATSAGPFPREHLLRHTAELAYGITERWWVEAYADFENPTREGAGQFTFVRSRFETVYRVFDRHGYWPAAALYLEYKIPQRRFEHNDELEWKLLLESRIEDFLVRLNPVGEREFNDASRVRFGYESGWYWFAKPAIRLGVEGFGNVGPIGSFPTTNFQRHSWGPAVRFKFGRVGWDLGMQFGWTDASDYAVFKSILDFEL
jgi:hypothetical protein